MAGYVIIGNGIAAAGCIEGIRSIDKETPITVVSEEKHAVYGRPLISYMLLGKTTAFILFIPGLNFWLIFYMIFIGFPINVAICTLATYWMLQFEDKHLHLISNENE